jgi:very-short-patch-repair endonuclease
VDGWQPMTRLGMTVPGMYSGERRQQIERASQEWRSALIDVSGANRLLFFKPTAATVSLADAEPGPLAELLAGATVKVSRLYADPLRRAAALKACKGLAAKQREAVEEYGVSVAFLAVGMATWALDGGMVDAPPEIGDSDPSAGPPGEGAMGEFGHRTRRTTSTKVPSAPVLLRALDLRARPGVVGAFELSLSGEVQLNPVLAHVMSFHGVKLDEEALLSSADDLQGELESILQAVGMACSDVPGFDVRPDLVIGPFSYLKQPMVIDCEDIEALLASDTVAALAGDGDALETVRGLVGDVNESDPDYVSVPAEYLILDADASQSYVINAALAGRNLVVQGPPGTGKSQTIANVIACLVAEGKRVLFVAQKRAAITAVLDRLNGAGLDDLTLDLFAAGASRRYVSDQLRTVLDGQANVREPVTDGLHRALTSSRDRLVSHRNALHSSHFGWGITAAQALAASYALPATARSSARLPARTLAGWGAEDLDALTRDLDELAERGGLAPDRFTRPGWSATYLTSGELVAAANEHLLTLRTDLLPLCLEALLALSQESGTVTSGNARDVEALLGEFHEVSDLISRIPGALDPQLDEALLSAYLAATDKRYRKSHRIRLGWLQRRRHRRAARVLLEAQGNRVPVDDQDLHRLLLRAQQARVRWDERGIVGPARGLSVLDNTEAHFGALGAGLARLAPAVQHIDLLDIPVPDLTEVLERLYEDRSRAQMPRLHALDSRLTTAGCGHLVSGLRREVADAPPSGHVTVAGWAGDRLQYAAIHSVIDQALTTDPALAGITGEHLDAASAEFADRDRDHLKANAARVRRAAAVRLTRVLDENPGQHLGLKSQVTRRRNFVPVRRLFEQAPAAMTAIKPVWAMSPLQVSRFLPTSPCFDVVIFDEASQVKAADAIPALLRAPQVIVAGDSRQLPPTEFFTKVLDSDGSPTGTSSEEELADEASQEDAALAVEMDAPPQAAPRQRQAHETYTQDVESILFALDRILAGQSRRLLWHYRSRDERLIATSNVHVYSGSLTTFPAADGEDCLDHIVVPSSEGIRGGTNSPAAEVQRLVSLVVDHAKARPEETLGVITFGVAHARRVEAALESAFTQDPQLEAALNGNPREPFFVKNIERVQGDERDAIILSVGYGKAADGRMRFFWGPLLKDGGERRLNVAISRARTRMTLVTSFDAEDVPEDAHHSAGFQLMYRFLRFMASRGTDLTNGLHPDVALNPFEIDMRDRLAAAGLDLVPQLGVGSYRLDFAVRHPEHPGRYVMAIEADGANYHSGHIARERDRLRQRQLEKRGWTFHRIWSTDWFHDPDSEVAAACATYNAALAADDAARPPADHHSAENPHPASWHLAEAKRTVPRPTYTAGLSIDKYDQLTLIKLVRHVRSDGVLRTQDEELSALMAELGFSKRGRRIIAAITQAQQQA